MFTPLLIAALGALNFGWQLLPAGGTEYVLRADRQTVEQFGREGIVAELPGELHDIRRVRFVIEDGAANKAAAELPNRNDLQGLRQRQELALRSAAERQQVAKPIVEENPALALKTSARANETASPSETQQQLEQENAQTMAKKNEQAWLLAAAGGLFGSLGANVYLGWLYAELRGRVRRQQRASAVL